MSSCDHHPRQGEEQARHEHSSHSFHQVNLGSRQRLWLALAVNLIFLVVEVAGGILTGSLALLADAGHMLTDVAALGLALFVFFLARRPATPERTYGFIRAEVLGAFINGATLFLVVGVILREAFLRIGQPREIKSGLMLVIAGLGLLANLVSAVILYERKENLNLRGVFLHMAADTLGSVAALLAGSVILATGWTRIDPIASLVIGALILISTFGLVRDTMNILLEATPRNISWREVKSTLEQMPNVAEVHDLHIWNITSGVPLLSAHLTMAEGCREISHYGDCLKDAQKILKEKFGIFHATLQMEAAADACAAECQLMENHRPQPKK